MREFLRTDKIYHHPERLLALKNGATVYPVTVEMHLTNKCNINCYYCSFKEKHDNKQVQFNDAYDAITNLAEIGVKGLTFSGGGEPTLFDGLPELACHVKQKGMDAALITNGIKFKNELIDNMTWIRFSLDAANDFTYKKIKGVDAFSRVIENIANAVRYRNNKKFNATLGIQAVVTEDNFEQIFTIAKLADSLGVDYFQYRPVEGVAPGNKPHIPKNNLRIKIIDTWYKWEELKDKICYTDCIGADFFGAIGVDMQYYICCHHISDSSASYGNILDKEAIFKNRKHIQNNFDYSKCKVACRGAAVNRRLHDYAEVEHINFL